MDRTWSGGIRFDAMVKTIGGRWRDLPVRIQILLAIEAISVCAALTAGGVLIANARAATRVELDASFEMAQRFVYKALRELAEEGKVNQFADELAFQVNHLRHVRVLMIGPDGKLGPVQPKFSGDEDKPSFTPAPQWFAALVRPEDADRAVPISLTEYDLAPVIITGAPDDEIAEAWQDFSAIALVWLVVNFLLLAVLYVVLGRILGPLRTLARGLRDLKDGHYAARLKPPKVKELVVIGDHFNALAEALDEARDENRDLYRRLIDVQETERREIAEELHDEAGPCLFGITANASSIESVTERLARTPAEEIRSRVAEIVRVAERLKTVNRTLIKRLRPVALGKVALSSLVEELVADFQRRHPATRILCCAGTLAPSYGERVDLTVYRCIQEGIINALRHGEPRNVFIEILEERPEESRARRRTHAMLQVTVRDDGKGMSPGAAKGFGLSTMAERVHSLEGAYGVESAPGRGTTIIIKIPVDATPSKRAPALEMAGG